MRRISVKWRCDFVSSVLTCRRSASNPCRFTVVDPSEIPSSGRLRRRLSISWIGAPSATSEPRIMSPLAPPTQSK